MFTCCNCLSKIKIERITIVFVKLFDLGTKQFANSKRHCEVGTTEAIRYNLF